MRFFVIFCKASWSCFTILKTEGVFWKSWIIIFYQNFPRNCCNISVSTSKSFKKKLFRKSFLDFRQNSESFFKFLKYNQKNLLKKQHKKFYFKKYYNFKKTRLCESSLFPCGMFQYSKLSNTISVLESHSFMKLHLSHKTGS